MKKELEICDSLADNKKTQVQIFLEKFLHHVKPDKLVICGGLATRYHLKVRGISFPQRPFNDLDLLIENVDDIKPSVTLDFMLYHYHPPGIDDPVEKTYFFYAFVDPVSRIKADVFPYRWSSSERFVESTFQGKPIKVVGIEDQLIQCLYDVSRISDKQKVDPKQLRDVHTLMSIADMSLAEQIWKHNHHPLYPLILQEAIKRADKFVIEHPEWWQEKQYRKPKSYQCLNCQNRIDYPITDMNEIFQVLGYVE